MKKIVLTLLSLLILGTSAAQAETVVFNPNSKIYHKLSCHSAQICKVCIKIDKQEAVKRGGRPCKKCGC